VSEGFNISGPLFSVIVWIFIVGLIQHGIWLMKWAEWGMERIKRAAASAAELKDLAPGVDDRGQQPSAPPAQPPARGDRSSPSPAPPPIRGSVVGEKPRNQWHGGKWFDVNGNTCGVNCGCSMGECTRPQDNAPAEVPITSSCWFVSYYAQTPGGRTYWGNLTCTMNNVAVITKENLADVVAAMQKLARENLAKSWPHVDPNCFDVVVMSFKEIY
jgi:hypothetical protein